MVDLNLKTIILFLLPALLAMAFIYYASHPRITYINYNAPYVEGGNVSLEAGRVVITILINNESMPFIPRGGWVKVVSVGQVVNLTVVSNNELVGYAPLMPQYLGLSNLGLEGLVYGSIMDHEAAIGFFIVTPVHVIMTIDITGINYTCNGGLTLTLNYSSPVPIIINSILNLQVVDNSIRQFVILPFVNYTHVNQYIKEGSGIVIIRIPQTVINGRNLTCSLTPGHIYTVSLLENLTYVYPTMNVTETKSITGVVRYG
ncbi:MAG: hypothetical protein TU36_003635 [Vulcanisaeta sp. AZ3]